MSSCRNRQTGTILLLRLIFNTFGQIIIYQTTSTHKNVSGLSSVISVVFSFALRTGACKIVSFCTFELNIFFIAFWFTQIFSQTESYFSNCRFSLLEGAVTVVILNDVLLLWFVCFSLCISSLKSHQEQCIT